jgi:hypothetical protein
MLSVATLKNENHKALKKKYIGSWRALRLEKEAFENNLGHVSGTKNPYIIAPLR